MTPNPRRTSVRTQTAEERPERYAFGWAGKGEALRALQLPSCAMLIPARDESSNFDQTQHLFIEGDNLAALKLLAESYLERVKVIYIDPPYNTGNDFVYVDRYTDPLDRYLEITGQKDADGHRLTSKPETSGRYHSAWLSMMYPRLVLARELLQDNGLIFVSIDDHEVHNLRMLMNEVFGEDCFKNCIIFRRGVKSVQAQFETVDSLAVGHEYLLMYAKSPKARFKKLYITLDKAKAGRWNNHWRGTNRPTMRYELFGITPTSGQWRWSQERSLRAVANYERMLKELEGRELTQPQIDEWYRRECEQQGKEIDLLRLSARGKPEHYVRPSDSKLSSDLWTDLSPRGSADLETLFGCKVFDNPKPVGLIKRLLQFTTEPHSADLILDFFAGSCTTAQAVLELNAADGGDRRFMMVQLPERLREPIVLADPDGPSVLQTIADIGKERIRRVAARLTSRKASDPPIDLGFKVFKLDYDSQQAARR